MAKVTISMLFISIANMIVFKLNIIKYHVMCGSLSWDFNRCLVWKPRGSRFSVHINGNFV